MMLSSQPARASSCGEITSIGDALTRADIVVVAQVVRRHDSRVYENYPEPAVVTVQEVMKGEAGKEMLVSSDYSGTFAVDRLGVGETFVIPTSSRTYNGMYLLPSCSHSALKLADGQLYTYEVVDDGSSSLEPYMSLTLLRALLPLRVLDSRSQFVIAAGTVLLLSMLITRRSRNRDVIAAPPVPTAARMDALRSLGWGGAFAVLWMLLIAGFCIFAGSSRPDWIALAIGVLFALAAIGIAFRLRWLEGTSYGLAAIFVGMCVFVVSDSLEPENFSGLGADTSALILFFGTFSILIALMLCCAAAVRRRFGD